MKILAACPACGETEWKELADCRFKCLSYGYECFPEEMELKADSDAHEEEQ